MAGRRIQGLADDRTGSVQLSITTGGTYDGINGDTVDGFANKIISPHPSIGKKINSVQMQLTGSPNANVLFGVWNSSSVLQHTFSNVTWSSPWVTFSSTTSYTLQDGDFIGFYNQGGSGNANAVRTTSDTVSYVEGWVKPHTTYNSGNHWVAGREYNMIFSSVPMDTNLQSGSRFEETDTRKIYYGALPSVTYEDDFSGTDDWADQGTKIAVNTSTDVLDLDVVRDGSSYATVYDLGAGNVSDTAWILRWRENYSTITTGSSSPHHYIGLSSGDQTVGGRSNQKCIVLRPYQTAIGTKALYATWCDSTHQPTNSPSANATVETFTASTSTDYFYEIRRTSSTEAVLSRYTDSTYSTTASSYTFTNLSGVDGLRYIKVGNDNGGAGAGQLVGIIDDIKFYNGVTSTTDFVWTEEV